MKSTPILLHDRGPREFRSAEVSLPAPAANIRVGIGGWNFAPWRGRFYPASLPQTQELHFASRRMTAIEVNGTFYRNQTPASYARWAAETPDGFLFAIKASRAATYRDNPSEVAIAVEHFLRSGLEELGSKLGPIIWQFPPSRAFDHGAMAGFLRLLPPTLNGIRLRHVIEATHPSFAVPAWIELLRQYNAAAAIVERDDEPLADVTTDFVYARLERNDLAAPSGYPEPALIAWAGRLQTWARGGEVADLPQAAGQREPDRAAAEATPRDCFVFFIGGDKQRAPDAAQAMLARLRAEPIPRRAVETAVASSRNGET